MTCIYYTASSLDGFIATTDHSLAWLVTRDIDADGPFGYPAFIERIGAMVMGATTYEWLRENGGGEWPYSQPTWVFTHRDLELFGEGDVRFVSGEVSAAYDDMLASAGDRALWVVGGGDLAGQFADVGLLDEVIVTFAPVTLGAGAPLLPRHLELRLEEVGRNADFAGARYTVVKA